MVTLHATCVVISDLAVLLRGPPGAGKSDLALRLIDKGARLIADDQVHLRVDADSTAGIPASPSRSGKRLIASCPTVLTGLLEVRGVGILPVPHQSEAPVALIVDLIGSGQRTARTGVPVDETPERLPCPEFTTILSVSVPRLEVNPFEVSAAARLRLAVAALKSGQLGKLPEPAHLSDMDFRREMGGDSFSPAVSGPPSPQQGLHPLKMTDDLATAPPSGLSPESSHQPGQLVLVTGMSGAGMSVALKALEDLGYEAIDNLRLSLVPALLEQTDPIRRPLALVIDSRTRDFSALSLLEQVDQLKSRPDLKVRLVFLDCGDEVLQRRFTETRRRHPLATDRPVPDGIQLERAHLAPLREHADHLFDTTQLSIHDLRRLLAGNFQLDAEAALQVFVTSFSFRQGLPREADLVFDVRFLDNPHYDPELRPLTGRDSAVAARVAADPDFPAFFQNLTDLLRPLLPRYNQEGKSYLTIAVGCTGGRHRSVFVAEKLAGWLTELGFKVGISHRELEKLYPRAG